MSGSRPRQLALALDFRPALGAEDFLVAPANADAVAWIDRWPAWPAGGLALCGPVGCGKTHLAQVWKTRSNAAVIAAEDFLGSDPIDLLGGAGAAVVEGAEAGIAERALLHLYNILAQGHGHLLLTGIAPPARWPIALADLRSRLGALPVAQVGAPDDAVLAAVMVKQFADRRLTVDDKVVGYILSRIERSFDAVRRVVAAIDRAALGRRRRLTVALAREVIGEHGDGP
ncbi:MAG: DNA replication protein [Alphaproteobacteria bacterium]|jgi:chromosomal replication initiation ATPase DnaA|nr:DNA replication protein [Alphaproteobacteria bacterium]MDP6517138.1 DNA replication protein [Alphaproteobacteria bacterium]